MRLILKILGSISGIVLVGSLIIMNAQPVHVDLVFVDGEIAVFLIIIASFLTGFFVCLLYLWLKKSLSMQKKATQKAIKRDDIFRDV